MELSHVGMLLEKKKSHMNLSLIASITPKCGSDQVTLLGKIELGQPVTRSPMDHPHVII